ncbi:hypothetical protein T08_10854, partial [Trichinella sp. T8]
ITSSPELLWIFICSEHPDKSCSDHFVLNAASVSIEFVPDCSCIVQYYFKVLIYFIHDSITLSSSEYDISSDGALWITSSHEACTVGNPCSHARKGVSYPSQCAFAYHKFIKKEFNIVYERNEIRRNKWYVAAHRSILFLIAMDYSQPMALIAFPTVLMFFLITQVFKK